MSKCLILVYHYIPLTMLQTTMRWNKTFKWEIFFMMFDKHVMQQSMNPYNKYGMNTSKIFSTLLVTWSLTPTFKGLMNHDRVFWPTLNYPHFLKLAIKFNILLFESNGFNILTSTLILLNTSTSHRCSNGFVDELLSLLQNSIFLKPNNLFKSHYEAKTMIQNLQLVNNVIHTCENGCILFYMKHNVAIKCPICGQFDLLLDEIKSPKKCLSIFL
jgi:hypothetical protein